VGKVVALEFPDFVADALEADVAADGLGVVGRVDGAGGLDDHVAIGEPGGDDRDLVEDGGDLDLDDLRVDLGLGDSVGGGHGLETRS
jgi:hypothetical protein